MLTMKPELVVPAGNLDALRAAVCNGADAIYLGGKKFNARIHARNFSLEELGQAIRYAHNQNVKVYVTVNTLIADRELCELDDYLTNLQHLETDAVIIQDLGVLKLCEDLHPGLRVHVSTQATVCSAASIKFWVAHGAQRVTLAREFSLEEIQKIKGVSGIEIEVFIHGALCFSFSGQCFLSSFLGERSANRGRCASPCRLPYTIVTRNGIPLRTSGPYLLSMKDLNLSEDIGKLVSAGVNALKIEGRMKIPEYIAVVTGIYRKIIDDDYRQPTQKEKRDLEAIFNRGFTKGFLYNYLSYEAMNCERPGNYGIEVGIVKGYNVFSKTTSILLSEDTKVGDGLEFQTSSGSKGLIVTKMFVDGRRTSEAQAKCTADIFLPFQPLPNSHVRKTRDSTMHKQARSTFFYLDEIPSINQPELHFSRQRGYERLSSILLVSKNERIHMKPKICAEVTGLESLRVAIKAGVDEIYFDGFSESAQLLNFDIYRQALDIANERQVPIAIVLPKFIRDDEFLKNLILKLKNTGVDALLVGDVGALELTRQLGLKTYLDSSLNVFNRLARNILFNYARRITLSQELNFSQIARIAGGAPGEVECIIQGPFTLMLSEYCPASNALHCTDKMICRKTCLETGFFIKDQRDFLYPIKCDEISRTHIISSDDICLIEYVPELIAAGIDVIRIRCHFSSLNTITEMIKYYKMALSINNSNCSDREILTSLKEKILKISKRKAREGKLVTGVE